MVEKRLLEEALSFSQDSSTSLPSVRVEHAVCTTTKGEITLEIHRDWSPYGADRFIDLMDRGYYNGVGLFRKNHWIIQFGAVQHPQTGVRKQFSGMRTIKDDPKTDCGGKCKKNKLWDGAISFAGGGKDSRSDQAFFVHHVGHQPLGNELWETPIGNITEGLQVLRDIYGGYGENIDQTQIFRHGNDYLKDFPKLDYIKECHILRNTLRKGYDQTVDSPVFTLMPQVLVYVVIVSCCLLMTCVYAVRKRSMIRKIL
mmetsp:Transcript_2402/g.3336  ORF Transcript_2402/g.3336 Transcript_2402/m.3336 type:complete len:256 (+) Transcript_2402:179-946(+)